MRRASTVVRRERRSLGELVGWTKIWSRGVGMMEEGAKGVRWWSRQWRGKGNSKWM